MKSFIYEGIEYRSFDSLYSTSKCGKALRLLDVATPYLRNDGYLELGRHRLFHRVVATCWLENPTNAKHVHHKNGIKSDNRVDNLEWLNPKEHLKNHPVTPYQRTPETIAKLVAYRTGFKDCEAVRAKKAAQLLQIAPKTTCRYKGVEYPSIAEAARSLNINVSTFRLRCKSKNFPDYEIVSLYYSRSN